MILWEIMNKIGRLFLFVILFFSFFSFIAGAKEKDFFVRKSVSDAVINFSLGEAVVVGNGIPDLNAVNPNSAKIMAENSARKNAAIKLAQALLSLKLDYDKDLKTYLKEREVTDFIDKITSENDFKNPISTRFYSDGSADLIYKIDIESRLKEIVNAVKRDFSPSSEPEKGREEARQDAVAEEAAKKDLLVVNLKTKKFEPFVFLSIVDEEGKRIYDFFMTDEERVGWGSVLFAKEKPDYFIEKLGFARSFLTVSAKSFKEGKIVLKQSEVQEIRDKLKKEALKKGRVVLVLN